MRELAVMEWLREIVVACLPGILFARTWACSALGWHPPSKVQWHLITWHFQSPPTFIHNYFSVTGLNSTFQVKGIWRTLAKDPAPAWSKGGRAFWKENLRHCYTSAKPTFSPELFLAVYWWEVGLGWTGTGHVNQLFLLSGRNRDQGARAK